MPRARIPRCGPEQCEAEDDPDPVCGWVAQQRQRGHDPGDRSGREQCVPRPDRLQRSYSRLMKLDVVDLRPAILQPDLGARVIEPEVVVAEEGVDVGRVDDEVQHG